MDRDGSSAPTRKVRFAPKGPPRKKAASTAAPKTEVVADDEADDDDDEATQALLRRVKEHLGRRGPKAEKKSSVQVAFAHGAGSSTSTRTFGKPREENDCKSDSPEMKDDTQADEQITISSPSTMTDGTCKTAVLAVETSSQKIKKDYREPWDYHHSYYPVTLPLRRPFSGDPELLDEAEFGEAAAHSEYDENNINSAAELGLLNENEDAQMLFLQLPPNLPLCQRAPCAEGKVTDESSKLSGRGVSSSARAKGKEKVGTRDPGDSPGAKGKEIIDSSKYLRMINAPTKACSLDEIPAGYMGKMLVYKSGAVKLKLGDTVFDVSPGSSCIFAQDVVAINTTDKDCCVVGEVGKRAVLTPDIESLLNDVIDLS